MFGGIERRSHVFDPFLKCQNAGEETCLADGPRSSVIVEQREYFAAPWHVSRLEQPVYSITITRYSEGRPDVNTVVFVVSGASCPDRRCSFRAPMARERTRSWTDRRIDRW